MGMFSNSATLKIPWHIHMVWSLEISWLCKNAMTIMKREKFTNLEMLRQFCGCGGLNICLTENPRIDSWNWAYLRFCTVHHFCISGSTCQRIRRAIRWHCLHSGHKRCEAQINIDSCVQNCPKDKCLETLSPTIDCRMLCRARVTSILWKPRALGFHAHPVQWDHRRCRQRWNWSACTSRLVQCSIELVAITSLVV